MPTEIPSAPTYGYVKLFRQIINNEQYKDPICMHLLVHLIITANNRPSKFLGESLPAGARVCTLPVLAQVTGLSIQQIRTQLRKLVLTGTLTDKSTNKFRVITLKKYVNFQTSTGRLTGNQQALTIKEIKKDIRNMHDMSVDTDKSAPALTEIEEYSQKRGSVVSAKRFYDYWSTRNWTNRYGKLMAADWKRYFQAFEKKPLENEVTAGSNACSTPDIMANDMQATPVFRKRKGAHKNGD